VLLILGGGCHLFFKKLGEHLLLDGAVMMMPESLIVCSK
jgi:hypothetical protein